MSVPTSSLGRWLSACKPASWGKLFLPALLGQAIGVYDSGIFNVASFVVGTLLVVLLLVFIVLLNDWGDQKVDAIKRKLFAEHCSPKTIVDGILPARSLLVAGVSAGMLAILVSVVAGEILHRPDLGLATLCCLAVFVAYTLPPIALNYRGGGELLEMVGVGVALPLLQAYVQSGEWLTPATIVLGGYAVMSLGSAIASGLSDEESDRIGGKRTWVTMVGNPGARSSVQFCLVSGALLWVAGDVFSPGAVSRWIVVVALLPLAWNLLALFSANAPAFTNQFKAQARYKRYLHRAIWHSGLIMSLMMFLQTALR